MASTTTLNETTRAPIDGTESVRLATAGANWKATLSAIESWLFGLVSGDGTVNGSTGALTVTKTNGAAFTGLATASPTAHGVLIGEAGAAPNSVVLGDAQVLVGQTAADPLAKSISGDATLADTGALTVTKTNGVALTGLATASPTAHGVLVGEGAAAPNAVVLGDAQVLIGQTGADPLAKSISGDGTLADTGALTVSKTGGVAFAASATTDTTNATNISSGSLATARLPTSVPSGRGATVNSPGLGNPAGTSSTAGVMAGLGVTITPSYSGRVFVQFTGAITNNTVGDGAQVTAYYGTGAAPANGAAVSGTVASCAVTYNPAPNGSQNVPFSVGAVITGLTPGTTYWLDLKQNAVTGGTMSIANVGACAFEF